MERKPGLRSHECCRSSDHRRLATSSKASAGLRRGRSWLRTGTGKASSVWMEWPSHCELIQSSVDVESVPRNNDVRDQVQRAQLILLASPYRWRSPPLLPCKNGAGQLVPVLRRFKLVGAHLRLFFIGYRLYRFEEEPLGKNVSVPPSPLATRLPTLLAKSDPPSRRRGWRLCPRATRRAFATGQVACEPDTPPQQ
jgi:hypothetical protein